MRTVDERVVDMQFNNRQFENGVRETVKSLDNLKNSLNLGDAVKGLSAGSLTTALDSIKDRFSVLGMTAINVLSNIMTKAIETGTVLLKSLTLDPVTDGFREYELQMNAITTIMTNTADKGTTMDQVTEVLKDLNEYADLTVYNFAQMTDNIGRFTANGVDLYDSAEAIKGIANLAAGAGSSTNQMNSSMVQLSQSIAGNRLQLQDWNSVVSAGMGGPKLQNALMKAAVAAGELDASVMTAVQNGEVGFRKLLDASKGGYGVNFTKDVMLEAFKELANDESLIEAATQVRTLTQLVETLKESAGSGWAQTWELVVGDKNEATAVWTAVKNAIESITNPLTEARNEALKFWKENGGRDAVIEASVNTWNNFEKVINVVKEAFSNVFPPITGQTLLDISKKIQDITGKFKIGETTLNNLRRTLQGAFSVIKTVGSAAFGVLSKLASALGPIFDVILSFTAIVGDLFYELGQGFAFSDVWGNFIAALRDSFPVLADISEKIGNVIGGFFGKIKDFFSQFGTIDLGPLKIKISELDTTFKPIQWIGKGVITMFRNIGDNIKKLVIFVKDRFEKLKEVFTEYLDPIIQKLKSSKDKLIEIFKAIGNGINKVLEYMGFDDIKDVIDTVLNAGILVAIQKFIKNFKGFNFNISNVFGKFTGIFDSLQTTLTQVKDTLKTYQTELKSKILQNIAIAIGILAAALFVLSSIPFEKLVPGLAGMTAIFTELTAALIILSKFMGPVKLAGTVTAMVGLAAAVLLISAALKNLSSINWNKLAVGVTGLTVIMAELAAALVFLTKFVDPVKLLALGAAMIPIGAGLVLLGAALKIMGSLNIAQMGTGLLGVAGGLAAIMGATLLIKPGPLLALGAAMIPIGAGLILLAAALKIIGSLNIAQVGTGLLGVAGGLAAIMGATLLIQPGPLLALGAAMIPIGIGLMLMASAIKIIGTLGIDEVGKGLLGFAGSLAFMIASVKLLNPAQLLKMGSALLVVSLALNSISIAMNIMSKIPLKGIGTSLLGFAGALAVMVAAMKLAEGSIGGAAAILAMSAALNLLAAPMMLLSTMDLPGLGIALLSLVGVFAVFGLAGYLLAPVAPVILVLAVALAAFAAAVALAGLGVLALGAGMAALAGAIQLLAIAGDTGLAALTAFLVEIISLIPLIAAKLVEALGILLVGIKDMLPLIFENVGLILSGTLGIIEQYLPQILATVGKIIVGVLDLLRTLFPEIFTFLGEFLTALWTFLREKIPEMASIGLDMLIELLKGIRDNIGEITGVCTDIIVNFVNGLAEKVQDLIDAGKNLIFAILDGIAEAIPDIANKSGEVIVKLLGGLAEAIDNNAEEIGKAAGKLAGALIKGLVKGIIAGISEIIQAISDLVKDVKKTFEDEFEIHSPSKMTERFGEQLTKGLEDGIKNGKNDVITACESVIKGVKKAIEDVDTRGIGNQIVNGLINGLNAGGTRAENAGRALGAKVRKGLADELGVQSPSREAFKIGEFVDIGLTEGIKSKQILAAKQAASLGATTAKALAEAIESAGNPSPVITPVVDMDKANKTLREGFNITKAFNLSGIVMGAFESVIQSKRNGGVPNPSQQAAPVTVNNVYNVRNDADIHRINIDMGRIVNEFNRSRGIVY